jgi:putative membrane protein
VHSTATFPVRSDRTFFIVNGIVSTAAVAFIAFILLRDKSPASGDQLSFLPAVNAVMNGLSASCLMLGYVAIRRRAVHVHRQLMILAFAFSAVFLVGYLTYHSVHGDTRFSGTGLERTAYLTMLASHIVLSITVVPAALTSFYFAFTGAFAKHRRLNRVFLPIWLYVSVTGVVIFFWLR